jgi:biotin-[acetyl-CoA-carboxylase] ligase BirA-like protein
MINWKPVLVLDETISTQTYLKNQRPLLLNQIVHTIKQTQGIGTHQRSWVSDEGDLLFSFAFEDFDMPVGQVMVAISLALVEVLDQDVKIKPPNDLIKDLQKCGGILIEKSLIHKTSVYIVGIGVNFVKKSHHQASHLKIRSFEDLLARFQKAVNVLFQTDIQTLLDRYNSLIIWDHLSVTYQNQPLKIGPLEKDFTCETSNGRYPWAHLNFEII